MFASCSSNFVLNTLPSGSQVFLLRPQLNYGKMGLSIQFAALISGYLWSGKVTRKWSDNSVSTGHENYITLRGPGTTSSPSGSGEPPHYLV